MEKRFMGKSHQIKRICTESRRALYVDLFK
jgi:hypothetical protein